MAGGNRVIPRPTPPGGRENGGREHRDSSIRVLVAGSQPLTRHAVTYVLEREPGIEPVGEAEDGGQALQKAVALAADVIAFVEYHPNGGSEIHLVTARGPVKALALRDRAGRSGADNGRQPPDRSGHEPCTFNTLASAIRSIQTGMEGSHVTTGLVDKPLASIRAPVNSSADGHRFTDREREVLRGVVQGLSDKEIGAKLFIAESTVKSHLRSLYQRFKLRNRAHAAVFACERGLLIT
jgi:DNA-binding NarL/FixJ family response regulator